MKFRYLLAPITAAVILSGCATSQQNVTETEEFKELMSRQAQLTAENNRLEELLNESSQSSLLPPNAKPNHCYARVVVPAVYETETETVLVAEESERVTVIPAQYETVTERVVVEEAYEELRVIPATYKTVTEQVLVSEASTELRTIPAEYRTVTEEVMVSPAYTTWEKGRGAIERIDQATGEIMCLVEVPAEYKTVTRQELVSPERTVEVDVPAQYKTVTRRVVDQPARTEKVTVPAVYETVEVVREVRKPQKQVTKIPAEYAEVTKQRMVSDADLEWREILCETNTTEDVVRRLQLALEQKGYDPVWIDGVYGDRTRNAVIQYQQDNGLPYGQLTMGTLQHMGVEL
ncbi:peptidoglycan-binding protein [Halomonas sp. TBZ9]|uniref:Peptidoglycan-binding protein n=1 Tax=Vreelandella azerica TaxID=2732867 RepID=A0A7Y3TWJ1_9GAMM|nr:peptidoglycan-binding domain-containing protein [Halomonas azerica]NOG31562.1 peptidoglycan-binding protein [Halomonas azerica]